MIKPILSFNESNDLGTVAHRAYRMLADRYNWDLLLASNFEPRKLLYAKNATNEGYSVWFLPHSNFISEDDTNGLWKNTFKKDMLLEEWSPDAVIKHGFGLFSDKTKRVTFAKKASGKYYFMGIYEVVDIERIGENCYLKIYKKTSTQYPEQK